MNSFKIDLDTISHQQFTVIINACKYKTTKKAAFFLSPALRVYSEKHPTQNSCKVDIEGSEEFESLISTILKLRGTFTITLQNYDFLRRFCDNLHITLFDTQLKEFNEKVCSISRSVSNEPHIRILKSIERELLKISPDRIDKIFDALSRASDIRKQDVRKSPTRTTHQKKDVNTSIQNVSNEEVQSIPIVKSPLTVCSALFCLSISQPQNIDMYVNLLSMLPNETIEKFKRIVYASNFESQEESFLVRMMAHLGLIKPDELKNFNRGLAADEAGKIKFDELRRSRKALKNGVNQSVIDINNISIEAPKISKENNDDSIGESFPTFFTDLATQKQLKLVSSQFDYFELNLPNLSKNNWELHKNLSFCGRNENPIAIAIRKDDVDGLQKLIIDTSFKKNSKIKPSIYERFTLMNVMKKENENKEDNENDVEGVNLIDFAAFFGALKCFKYLLLNGFEFSSNSFSFAICGGVSEIIHICEDKKCQSKGSLFSAIQFHRHEIFNWLIETKGEDPFEEEQVKIAKFIVQYFNIDAMINLLQRGFNPSLFILPAIECGNLLLIEYLATIQHLNFNDQLQLNKKKIYPIIYASVVGFNCDMIKFLIKYCKCDINQKGKSGLTPLHFACLNNDEETVNFLIKQKNIEINSTTKIFFNCFFNQGLTPLHLACQIGSTNIVSLLLSNEKIDVNFGANLDDNGITPLHIACKEGNFDVVKKLLSSQKVNKLAKTKNFSYTPFHFACQSGNLNLVQFFISSKNGSINEGIEKHLLTPLHVACFSERIDVVTFLLKQANIDINAKSTMVKEIEYIDVTPLHLACLNGKGKIVEILINNQSIKINSIAEETVLIY